FGSREGLVSAVVERAIRALEVDLMQAMAISAGDAAPNPLDLLDRVGETLTKKGHARQLAWLLLAGYDAFDDRTSRANWRRIAEILPEGRLLLGKRKKPTLEDSQFVLILASLVLFGEAIFGEMTMKAAGLDRAGTRRFRAWFAALLDAHVRGD